MQRRRWAEARHFNVASFFLRRRRPKLGGVCDVEAKATRACGIAYTAPLPSSTSQLRFWPGLPRRSCSPVLFWFFSVVEEQNGGGLRRRSHKAHARTRACCIDYKAPLPSSTPQLLFLPGLPRSSCSPAPVFFSPIIEEPNWGGLRRRS